VRALWVSGEHQKGALPPSPPPRLALGTGFLWLVVLWLGEFNSDSETFMTDIATIMTSLSTAGSVAKSLLDIKSISNSAEARLAIAELQNAIADSRGEVADLKNDLVIKDDMIRTLKEKLSKGAKLVRHNEMYFDEDADGQPIGDPYCPRCLEAADLHVHLVTINKTRLRCNNCDKGYSRTPHHNNETLGVVMARRNRF